LRPEEIVASLGSRPGYRVADFATVGVPVFRLWVRVFTQRQKKLPPVEEFLLRLAAAGLQDTDDMAAFLGIPSAYVDDTLSQLLADDLLALRAGSDRRQRLHITGQGYLALEAAQMVVPEERTQVVEYDATTRRIAFYGRDRLLSSAEMRQRGYKQIRPLLPKPLDISDLPVADVQRTMEITSPRRETRRHVLGVRCIEKKQLYFLPAIAVVYRSLDRDDIQVCFVIDGRMMPEHEQAFARADGPRRLGIERDLSQLDESAPEIERLVEEAKTARNCSADKLPEVTSKQISTTAVRSSAIPEPWAHLDAQQQGNLKETGLCYLAVHDHPALLNHALTNSRHRLVIISPFVNESVVDDRFLHRLEALLRRSVRVFIGYGMPHTEGGKPPKAQMTVVQKLTDVGRTFSNLRVCKLDSHAKVLIEDETFLALGSFNWLSFHGDPERPFRDEQSVLIRIPSLIEEKYQSVLRVFA
jgi:hypothetical protein